MANASSTNPFPLARMSLVLAVGAVAYLVLKPVFNALVWGAIIAILVSPIQRLCLRSFRNWNNSIALILVAGSVSIAVAPLIWGLAEVQSEMGLAYLKLLKTLNTNKFDIPDQIGLIPVVGSWLHDKLEYLPQNAHGLIIDFKELIPMLGRGIGHLLRELTSQTFDLVVMLISAFFFLRDGAKIMQSAQNKLTPVVGHELEAYLKLIASTVYAVSFGLVGSALAQGAIATIGYTLMGLETPLLLGVLSAAASMIPFFGASLVWGPIAMGLLLNDELMMAVALTAWGFLIIHPTDNFLRPLLISHLMHYPLSLVMLGVVGGLISFGVVGIFVGPTILAIVLKMWLDWSKRTSLD